MSLFEFDQEEYDRNRFEEGKAVGVAEGIAKGHATGVAEGERSAKIESAKNLLKMNILSVEQIAQATQLTADDVNSLVETVL